ncbi:hypothetical protein N9137_04330 [Pseudomonadales bacterium]|nr:hypothetical protein [Pseudomonadales bacterium]
MKSVRTLFNRWCNESQGLLDPDDRCLLSSSCLTEQTYSISREHHNLLRSIKKRLFFAFAHKPDHFDPAASDDVASQDAIANAAIFEMISPE